MSTALPPLSDAEADEYLARLGLDRSVVESDAAGLVATLSRAHLTHVPFENLDQVFGAGVAHDLDAGLAKLLAGRGGWCFELNGSFARLLEHLGHDVLLIGCAVLLDGPSDVLEHVALEVSGGPGGLTPHLVDVGFGDSFVTPLALNRPGPQPGGNGAYELIASPKGTTLARHGDDGLAATLRFKRVALSFEAFAGEAERLQTDPTLSWSSKPFATRLDDDGSRLTLRTDVRHRCTADGTIARETITSRDEWDRTLLDWFEMERPGPWPDGFPLA